MKQAFINLESNNLSAQNLIFLLALFSIAAVFSSCRTSDSQATQSGENVEQQNDRKTASFNVPAPDINLAKPLQISTRGDDVQLCAQINQTIDESEYANARWGVFVLSLKDGRVVCGRDARQLFNPASIEKTLTAIVALDRLGADYRYKTSVLGANQIDANGDLNGDLTVYGTGAPDFDEDALSDLIKQLQAKGLKRVKGNVVGDASYFKGMTIGDGWTWNDLQWHYGAEANALTYRENQAAVYMDTDGKPATSTDYLHLHGEIKPTAPGQTEAFGVERGLEDNELYVWGNGAKAYGRLSVHNPALWTAKILKESLEKKGIIVDSGAEFVDWKTENRADAATLTELAAVESKPLSELVKRMNKHSINLYGELLLRTLGKKFGAEAPDESRQIQELRGDDAAGASLVKKWLRDKNVAVEDIQIHDGSGLSRLDFLTPESFGRAMVFAAKSNYGQVFADSLPISGTDGTLGGRLGNVKGKVLAKTGTITFVNSLTGFAQVKDDEIYAFAVIANNITHKSDGARIIDRIVSGFFASEKDKNENGEKK